MSPVFNVQHDDARGDAVAAATMAVGQGKLVVLPTDTVYGVGADPFDPGGVAALLAAKGRGRDKPPAVLVPNAQTVDGLAMNVPSYARRLMERFWPGGLTLIFRAQPSLMWDLGDTNGTVGLRMPDDEFALALLESTGPLAVSSANRTGERPVTSVADAGFAFGPAVEVYLDGGPRQNELASTIIDCTRADPRLLRRGTITPEQLREVLGPIDLHDSTGAPLSAHPGDGAPAPGVGRNTPEDRSGSLGDDASADGANPGLAAAAGSSETEAAPTQKLPTRRSERRRLEALGRQGRAEEPTQVIPLGGVGAEPPFDREAPRSVELPGRGGQTGG